MRDVHILYLVVDNLLIPAGGDMMMLVNDSDVEFLSRQMF